ncbi:hypothetical protein GCM10017044_22600 [Kordiimonas sediminis]|uniref:Uncharacterized protein n=1 Tax=Kordiimonas sediminis TaxID=1735581 RepID=A0A919E987_9PROT|nr:flagellar biosynthetic protein FliO [Kordiimonas sediminis]GHF27037.1 hypothetical protein GCM10017044_22600 [Kordiimonas sediminis]
MLIEFLGALTALIFVLGLIFIITWAVKKFGLLPGSYQIKKEHREIEILDSKMIDARSRVLVVRWRDKDYLVGNSPSGLSLLDSVDAPSMTVHDLSESEQKGSPSND